MVGRTSVAELKLGDVEKFEMVEETDFSELVRVDLSEGIK